MVTQVTVDKINERIINSAYNGEPVSNTVVSERYVLHGNTVGSRRTICAIDPVTTDSKEEIRQLADNTPTLITLFECKQVDHVRQLAD